MFHRSMLVAFLLALSQPLSVASQTQPQPPARPGPPGGGDSEDTEPGPPPLKRSSPPPIQDAFAKDLVSHDPDCGGNSLYVFLRLKGTRCSLGQIKQEVPMTGQGASLLALKEAARKFKVDAAVVRVNPSELVQNHLPAIARLSTPGSRDEGHYVVVTRGDGDSLMVIDGTTGVVSGVALQTFEREYSGYALVATPGPRRRWLGDRVVLALGALVALEVCALALVTLRPKSPAPAAESRAPTKG
jgi:hypothetical protein